MNGYENHMKRLSDCGACVFQHHPYLFFLLQTAIFGGVCYRGILLACALLGCERERRDIFLALFFGAYFGGLQLMIQHRKSLAQGTGAEGAMQENVSKQ